MSEKVKSAIALPTYGVQADGDAYVVTRNGQLHKTPTGGMYRLPTQPLAEAVAAEWSAQGPKPQPAMMPMTQLAATALDIVPQKREQIIDQLAAYAGSELLCHRAEVPVSLAQRQTEVWQPLLDWCALRFDALLLTGSGIMPIAQPPEAVRALRLALTAYDQFWLSGVSAAVDASGSLVLGLAMAEKHLDASAVFHAAELDASYQMDRWGEDAEVVLRHEGLRRELEACEKWFGFLG